MNKFYTELVRFQTFDERFDYLILHTALQWDYERYLNQALYQSREWRKVREEILVRDYGCDLAIPDRQIFSRPTIHHINPITIEDIEHGNPIVFDPENLITTSHSTHKAIHYGNPELLIKLPKERRRGDTKLW